jgi:hypothetical protein
MCNLSTDVLAPCALMARVVKCDNFLLNTKIRSSPAYSQKKKHDVLTFLCKQA